jgi:hypothetical protein
MKQRNSGQATTEDEYEEILKALGKRIKKLRKEKGLTLREMEIIHGYRDYDWRRLESAGAGNMRGARGTSAPHFSSLSQQRSVWTLPGCRLKLCQRNHLPNHSYGYPSTYRYLSSVLLRQKHDFPYPPT